MPEEKFKLPKSSYEELTKVIRAYGRFDEPVGLDEVSKLIAANPTRISANVGFLIAAGILETGAKKKATAKGKELALALEHEMPDEIRRSWRAVVSECEFLSRLVAAVKIRKGMDESTLHAHIAYSAGQPKTASFMTGARTVTEILRAAELVRESDGKFVAEEVTTIPALSRPSGESLLPPKHSQALTVGPGESTTINIPSTQGNGIGVQVTIQVRVNCTSDELEGLGAKLRAVIDDITANAKQDAGTDKKQGPGADIGQDAGAAQIAEGAATDIDTATDDDTDEDEDESA